VEGLTQITIDATTSPSTNETLDFIEEIETDVKERNLYTRTATDEYVDVAPTSAYPGSYNVSWDIKRDSLSFTGAEGVIVTLPNVKRPIISITTLSKNDEAPDDTASWDALTEGPADGSSFILLTTGNKASGYALWFYDNIPLAGPKRLKMTYTYGHNLNTEVLDRYSTLGVGIKVLQARRGTSAADGLTEFDGGTMGVFVPTQYSTRIAEYRDEMKEIEKNHFPSPELAMAVF